MYTASYLLHSLLFALLLAGGRLRVGDPAALGRLEEVHAVDGGGRAHAALPAAPAAARAAQPHVRPALRVRLDQLPRPVAVEAVGLGAPPEDPSEKSSTFDRGVSRPISKVRVERELLLQLRSWTNG